MSKPTSMHLRSTSALRSEEASIRIVTKSDRIVIKTDYSAAELDLIKKALRHALVHVLELERVHDAIELRRRFRA